MRYFDYFSGSQYGGGGNPYTAGSEHPGDTLATALVAERRQQKTYPLSRQYQSL